jgi:hypothetical protein
MGVINMKLKDALIVKKQHVAKENNRRYLREYYQRNKPRAVEEGYDAPER